MYIPYLFPELWMVAKISECRVEGEKNGQSLVDTFYVEKLRLDVSGPGFTMIATAADLALAAASYASFPIGGQF